MAKFLTQAETYRLIQRELPEGAYPDGEPARFYSTADSDATAKTISTLYSNMEEVGDNYFPQTAESKLDDWEIFVLGGITSGLTTTERRDAIINRPRRS